MPPVASTSSPTPFPLTEPNLRSHTSLEGIAPRRTVQIYLKSIEQSQGYFELPRAPTVDSKSPPARHPLASTTYSALEQPEAKRRKVNDVDEAENFRDTALVMHSGGDAPTQQVKGFGNLEKPAVPLKKKPSLVSAMRPRFSSVNNNSSSPLNKESKSTEEKPKKKEVGNEEKENLRRGNKAVENDQKAKGRLSEVGIDAKKNSEKAKGKLRAEVETAEEAAELEERLEARKVRRRNKAFIRKDRSQSATATGIAAASRMKPKISTKRGHREGSDRGSEDSDLVADETGKKRKKGRKSAEQSGRDLVQGLARPTVVGTGRLTLKTSNELGLFNKGKASARVKVGKAVPDLAFSEMRFLNSTKPPPAESSCSASEKNPPNPLFVKKTTKGSSRGKTYGSKNSLRRLSSANLRKDDSSCDSDSERLTALPRGSHSPRVKEKSAAQSGPTSTNFPRPRRVSTKIATPPPPSRASSRSSLRLRKLPPDSAPFEQTPKPSQEALEFAAQEDSNFSAHSAHSLAIRRRSQSLNRPLNPVEIYDQPVGTVHEDPPVEDVQALEEEEPFSRVDPTILSPIVAHGRNSLRHVDESSVLGAEKLKKEFGPSSSIHTASMDRILRDNASADSIEASFNSVSALCMKTSSPRFRGNVPTQPHLIDNRSRSRSRSFTATPSYRSRTSFIPRQRSLSDAAVGYEGVPLKVNNPFAPSNFVVPSETFTETDSGAQEQEGEFLDVLASFWNDDSNQLANGNEKEETERFDESFSQPSCQFYAIEEASVGSMEDSDSKGAINDATAVKEQVVANLWHKNIL